MKAIQSAHVFVGDVLAGTIEKTPSGGRFSYDRAYLDQANPKPVASSLPVTLPVVDTFGINLHSYFANLLPEGLRLDAIASRIKASREDRLSLLVAAGDDAIGDVTVRGSRDAPTREAEILDPSIHSFRSLFEARFGLGGTDSEALSIAGVQEKVSASRITMPVRLPGQSREGYIVNLNLNPANRPCLVENEHFFLQMAKSCGLSVAKSQIVKDKEGDAALAVTRFDRVRANGALVKLHQEDACQFLDLFPDHKYDVSLQQVAKALGQVCTAPEVEILRLLELYAFSYLIANGDLHAKNISVLTDLNGITRLSPCYDLLSTWPYKDHQMALKLDGRDQNFKPSHFIRFGERFGIRDKAIRKMLERLYEKSEPWLDKLHEVGFPDRLGGPLNNVMRSRRADLIEVA